MNAIPSQTSTFLFSIRTTSKTEAPLTLRIPISFTLSREIKTISPSKPVSARRIVHNDTNSIKRAMRVSLLYNCSKASSKKWTSKVPSGSNRLAVSSIYFRICVKFPPRVFIRILNLRSSVLQKTMGVISPFSEAKLKFLQTPVTSPSAPNPSNRFSNGFSQPNCWTAFSFRIKLSISASPCRNARPSCISIPKKSINRSSMGHACIWICFPSTLRPQPIPTRPGRNCE